MTSSTSSGFTPARLTVSRTTSAPKSVAVNPFNEPKNFPTGVLTALMITAAALVSLMNNPEKYLLFTIYYLAGGVSRKVIWLVVAQTASLHAR
jgi:hypothetical protein